jgi:hypothetical protein
LPEAGGGTESLTSANPEAQDVIAFLERKRAVIAELPVSRSRDNILRAIDELIAEYRAQLEGAPDTGT